MHTKVVDTWLDVIIETCDRKMSSELYKVAKRLR
jgi:GTP cyclohydrolase FolE2